eukprot:3188244-Lingulodinium_polyedra.AAC.1
MRGGKAARLTRQPCRAAGKPTPASVALQAAADGLMMPRCGTQARPNTTRAKLGGRGRNRR